VSAASHRTAPTPAVFLLAECYGCANHTLIKDVTVTELKARKLPTLPFERVPIDLLACARQVKQFQIINGLKPHLLEPALRGEHVGTIVRKDGTD
jgi:molybdenum storage protein